MPVHVPVLAVSTAPTLVVPEMVGADTLDGGTGAEAIAAVCADTAVAEPARFVPVTATRIVVPTSAATSVYVCPVAPAMSAQLPPPLSQRRHW